MQGAINIVSVVMTINYNRKSLYPFRIVYESELLSRMAQGSDRRTGYEEVAGQNPISVIRGSDSSNPDIRDRLDFEFYDLVLAVAGSTYQAKLHRFTCRLESRKFSNGRRSIWTHT
jgi:hypothetical protein